MTKRKGMCDSVHWHQGKSPDDWSVYGIRKWERFIQASIIEDVDLALKALEIVYRENGAAVEGLVDINGNKCKR